MAHVLTVYVFVSECAFVGCACVFVYVAFSNTCFLVLVCVRACVYLRLSLWVLHCSKVVDQSTPTVTDMSTICVLHFALYTLQESSDEDSEFEESCDSPGQQQLAEIDRALQLLDAVSHGHKEEASALAPLVFSNASLSILCAVGANADDVMLDDEIGVDPYEGTYGVYKWDDLHEMSTIRCKALELAVEKNDLPMLRILLRFARQPRSIELQITRPFEIACREGRVSIVEHLLEHHKSLLRGASEDEVPPFRQGLAVAVESAQGGAVKAILSQFPVNVNVAFDYWTPSHDGEFDHPFWVAESVSPHMDLTSMYMLDHAIFSREVLEALLAHGLDVNRTAEGKDHALIKCCQTYLCPIEVVRVLLDRRFVPELNVDKVAVLDALDKGNRTDKDEVRALIASWRNAKE